VRVAGLLEELPIGKLRQLGGKFGDEVQQALGITTVGALCLHSQTLLGLQRPCSVLGRHSAGVILCHWCFAGELARMPRSRLDAAVGEEKVRRQPVYWLQCFSLSAVGLYVRSVSGARRTCGTVQAGWLARLARGLDDEAVKPRLLPKSVGCSKTFRGRSALTTLKLVHDWLLSIGVPPCRLGNATCTFVG
jgi:hypothetical protein